MTAIDVTERDDPGGALTVEVCDDDGSRTTHEVTVSDADWERFGAGHASRAALVEASFRFLLGREPKESILRAFDLGVIERYFPDYRATIRLES